MINTFIDVTTFGQTVGGTFDLTVENPNEQINLGSRRITPVENCAVENPVFEKNMQDSRIMACVQNQDPRQIQKLIKAFETETRRVNSLAMLNRELNTILSMEDQSKMVLVYVPAELLREIDNGQYKFFLDGTSATTYYSEMELSLWRVVVQQIQTLFHRIIFKNIASCKTNKSNSQIQGCRVFIYKEMYTMLLNAYKECKALKEQAIRNASGYSNANANNGFGGYNNAFGGNNAPSQYAPANTNNGFSGNAGFGGNNGFTNNTGFTNGSDFGNNAGFGSNAGYGNFGANAGNAGFGNTNPFNTPAPNTNPVEQGSAFGAIENTETPAPNESAFSATENTEDMEGVNEGEDFETPENGANILF